MNARLEALELEKRALLDRSALCRLHLRREMRTLRGSMSLKGASIAVAAAPAARAMAWSVALSFLGVGRVARLVLLAGRVVLIARLARAAIGYARGPVKPAYLP
jgi:hypothetical protein